MKRLIFLLCFLFIGLSTFAQQDYTVEGTTYTLNTEVEGTLTLLWNTIDGEYRYFAKKGEAITELKNTQINGTYQEEYKEALRVLTKDEVMPVSNVKLTTASLRNFFNDYNKRKDPNFDARETAFQPSFRLGPFLGTSNAIFTSNTDNENLLTAGFDFEVTDDVKLRRHAVVFRFKQTFSSDAYDYSASQLSLNYRFKFIKSATVDVYVNTKFVALTNSKRSITFTMPGPADAPVTVTEERKGTDFSAPGAFGLGADIKLGNGYLFVTYNDIVAVGVSSNDEFPLDLSVGYKFSL
ncbi:hypothetical protein ACFQO1_02145 [Jejudonia soesokkakensis]|uniref:Outer membrane protein beta-barrel domain-containing protein n=1 Tax=Jejudonia soesokkakensis TaxID=1323432 RepID=A0ABW2MSE7_9FLAO